MYDEDFYSDFYDVSGFNNAVAVYNISKLELLCCNLFYFHILIYNYFLFGLTDGL
jgi:hypothetical protein